MTPQDVAKYYFELSNKSDFNSISKLLTASTTYSSQNTGLYLSRDEIVAMQKVFHGQFSSLQWHVNSVKEVKPGIMLFDFDFFSQMPDGTTAKSSGHEYIIVYGGKIQHIEVRNK